MVICSERAVNVIRKVSPKSVWLPIGSFFLLVSRIAYSIERESVCLFTKTRCGILSKLVCSHMEALKGPMFTLIFRKIFY